MFLEEVWKQQILLFGRFFNENRVSIITIHSNLLKENLLMVMMFTKRTRVNSI